MNIIENKNIDYPERQNISTSDRQMYLHVLADKCQDTLCNGWQSRF